VGEKDALAAVSGARDAVVEAAAPAAVGERLGGEGAGARERFPFQQGGGERKRRVRHVRGAVEQHAYGADQRGGGVARQQLR
jgi:hypothetical protein